MRTTHYAVNLYTFPVHVTVYTRFGFFSSMVYLVFDLGAVCRQGFDLVSGSVAVKLAVLSDIHGNLAALQAVAAEIECWQPDAIVVAGDIVNRGPLSRQCLAFVQARQADSGWQVLRGNHEEYVIKVANDPSPRQGVEEAVRANVRWTAAQLGDVDPLQVMPTIIRLHGPDGGEVRVVHASMRYNRDNILIDTPDDLLRAQIAPPPALFCCGHTHRPLVRIVDGTLVVNAGAVGLPFDGDRRASYTRLTWEAGSWQAEIARVAYDYAQTARDYVQSGFMDASGPVAPIIYEEFRTALPRLSTWFGTYEAAVLAGKISAADAVQAFLKRDA